MHSSQDPRIQDGFSIDSSRSGAAYSDTVGFGLGIQQRRKLRMATGAPVINDLLPSPARATSAPTFLFDHRQREVDHPGQGPHRAVDDENSRSSSILRFWVRNLQ